MTKCRTWFVFETPTCTITKHRDCQSTRNYVDCVFRKARRRHSLPMNPCLCDMLWSATDRVRSKCSLIPYVKSVVTGVEARRHIKELHFTFPPSQLTSSTSAPSVHPDTLPEKHIHTCLLTNLVTASTPLSQSTISFNHFATVRP